MLPKCWWLGWCHQPERSRLFDVQTWLKQSLQTNSLMSRWFALGWFSMGRCNFCRQSTSYEHTIYLTNLSRCNLSCRFNVFQYGFMAVNYLDNFGGAEVPDRVIEAYRTLEKLLLSCGLEGKKCRTDY